MLKPPKPGPPALAGTEAPPPKEKAAGAVDAGGSGTLLDAAPAAAGPSVRVPLLGLVSPGSEAPAVPALLGWELLSAGAPKLKVAVGAAAGKEGAAWVGAVAHPKLNCPSEPAGSDRCPDCEGPAIQTAKSCHESP